MSEKEKKRLLSNSEESISGLDTDLSIQQTVLKWENLTFQLNLNDDPKNLLNNLSGFTNPGELTAIMGASGSGKTSLLSILSGRLKFESNFNISGLVTLNDKEIDPSESWNAIRFVEQDSKLFECMTPFEYLYFNLKLKSNFPDSVIKEKVNSMLNDLKLSEIAHNAIGGVLFRGISGGEKKRVCIACELIFCPSVLILDEPTSGLDSFTAKLVVRILKKVALKGVNVIFSIHQPGNEIFRMFDKLILMQEGWFVYQGPAQESVVYFEKLEYPVPKQMNPGDYYMRLLKVDDRNNISPEEEKIMQKLRQSYKVSEEGLWKDVKNQDSIKTEENTSESAVFLKSMKLLFWREFIVQKRNPIVHKLRFGLIAFYVTIQTILFYDLGYDNRGVDDRRGFLNSIIYDHLVISSLASAEIVLRENLILFKELKNGLYSINSYILVKTLSEVPLMILVPFVYVFTSYYLVGLNQEKSEKVFILYLVCLVTYAQGMIGGLLAGSITSDRSAAIAMVAVVFNFMIVYSGMYSDPEAGVGFLTWLRFLSPIYYIRNAALKNEFDDLDFDDNVYPRPEERYNYEGEIHENLLWPLVHLSCLYLLALICFMYRSWRDTLKIRLEKVNS